MPLFEYICKDCNKRFEALVFGHQQPECPACHGSRLEQQISVFSVGGGSTSRSGSLPANCGGGSGGSGGT